MSAPINDGGPAFPFDEKNDDGSLYHCNPGMTLRDFFAANAPGGWIDELRKDAGRWRRLVNASEMPFPILALADDPENDCLMVYGRKRLEERIDECDLIPDTYAAMKGDQP